MLPEHKNKRGHKWYKFHGIVFSLGYRNIEEEFILSRKLRKIINLKRVPCYTTIYRAVGKLTEEEANFLRVLAYCTSSDFLDDMKNEKTQSRRFLLRLLDNWSFAVLKPKKRWLLYLKLLLANVKKDGSVKLIGIIPLRDE